jgi:hypothetical protein
MFPALARAALADILRRYRRVRRRLHRQTIHVIHGPRRAVSGPSTSTAQGRRSMACTPDLPAARDLSSGQQLAWPPVRDATAASVVAVLTSLFGAHSAPLVLKSDIGSAFADTRVQALCDQFGVRNLFSPPRRPEYNGSIEAGIGSLTSRTNNAAVRRDHPTDWTYDDAAVARLEPTPRRGRAAFTARVPTNCRRSERRSRRLSARLFTRPCVGRVLPSTWLRKVRPQSPRRRWKNVR